MTRETSWTTLLVAGGLQAAGLVACISVPGSSQTPTPALAASESAGIITSPVRAARPPQTVALPELEVSSSELPSLTLELETIAKGAARGARRTITRTPTRAHVKAAGSEVEWLFTRNPVDQRRVSAVRIDHHHHIIIDYSESELRTAELARGWADVVYLGVEVAALRRMSLTGRTETLDGFHFAEYSPNPGSISDSGSIWWSRTAGAPLRRSAGGTDSQLVLARIRTTVDASLLQDPRHRFPSYAVMDVADFREKDHEHGSR